MNSSPKPFMCPFCSGTQFTMTDAREGFGVIHVNCGYAVCGAYMGTLDNSAGMTPGKLEDLRMRAHP